MASITQEQFADFYEEYLVKPLRKFGDEHPHLLKPFQLIVETDDGTEVDLCDITKPLPELVARIG